MKRKFYHNSLSKIILQKIKCSKNIKIFDYDTQTLISLMSKKCPIHIIGKKLQESLSVGLSLSAIAIAHADDIAQSIKL